MRLVERARRPGLEPLWDEMARRFSASGRPVTTVVVGDLPEESRVALADLLGLDRLPSSPARVRVADVARALGLDGEAGVRELVESIVGPLGNRARERQEERARRDELWSWLAGEAARLELGAWAEAVRGQGIPAGDVEAHRRRLRDAVAVLDRVLAADAPPSVLAHLAADVLGDPHGLDPGRAVGALVVDALTMRGGLHRGRRAEVVRAVWSSAGVATDELSPTVLALGLRPDARESSPVAASCTAMAAANEPVVLTLSQLQRWPLRVAPTEVRVVENPSIIMHAARETELPTPMACTGGWPNVAVLTLLRQLSTAGCQLRAHADFDPAGILIIRYLVDLLDVHPWKMAQADYVGAVDRSVIPFDGSVADTPWDRGLAAAMREQRRAVFEEDVRTSLLRRD